MRRKIVSLLLVIAIVCAQVSSAYAYVDASSRIHIYYQQYSSKNEWSKLKLADGKTMGTSGCLIFAYAHAIQWLTGRKVSDTSLITSLISDGNRPSKVSIDYYAERNTMTAHGLGKGSGSISVSTLKNILNGERVIIANTSFQGNKEGHYVLAVEYVEYDVDNDGDKELLIHIVDSSVRSTYRRYVAETSGDRDEGHYARGYTMYDFTTFKPITKLMSEQCGQYSQ